MAYLHDGIKRLRAVNAKDDEDAAEAQAEGSVKAGVGGAGDGAGGGKAKESVSLWRGMRNLELPDEFREHGGTELAPMSTTMDIRVALAYSDKAEKRLLFKVVTEAFIDRGADLRFLSAFPQEVEILYPPLTLLLPTGREDLITVGGVEYGVVEVEPRFAT